MWVIASNRSGDNQKMFTGTELMEREQARDTKAQDLRYQLSFSVDAATKEKLSAVQALLASRQPQGHGLEEVFGTCSMTTCCGIARSRRTSDERLVRSGRPDGWLRATSLRQVALFLLLVATLKR
jgi:hypothetical protein